MRISKVLGIQSRRLSTAAKAVAACALLSCAAVSSAAEIKVLGALATRAITEDLAPKFEKVSGHKVTSSFANTSDTVKRIQGGEIPDLILTNVEGIDSLVKDGKIVKANVIAIARTGLAVAVLKGASKPDISSADALKRALLAAKSITYNDPAGGGASGRQFAGVIERLGIAKELQSKTIYSKNDAGALVAAGRAELGVTQMSSLMPVAGLEIVGLLPGEFKTNSVYSAAILAGAKNADAAKALITFLRGAEAVKVLKAKGMEPG